MKESNLINEDETKQLSIGENMAGEAPYGAKHSGNSTQRFLSPFYPSTYSTDFHIGQGKQSSLIFLSLENTILQESRIRNGLNQTIHNLKVGERRVRYSVVTS